jgi:hypothetical protein
MMISLLEIDNSRKQEPSICCPHCTTNCITHYGSYLRSRPKLSVLQRIPRFRCKSPTCPWKTFSVLPHPLLPIVRHFSETIRRCMSSISKQSQARYTRIFGLSRGVVKRLVILGAKFLPWFDHEKKIVGWGPNPDAIPLLSWPDFIRDFSQSFYPKRWLMHAPTQ